MYAMIKVAQELPNKYPDAKMLVQVHDELVFEVSDHDVKNVSKFVKKTMEGIVSYEIPLDVEIKIGQNWTDMKSIKI